MKNAARIIELVQRYRYGRLGTAIGSGLATFALLRTLAAAAGLQGSLTLFLVLLVVSLVTTYGVHAALLHHRNVRLELLRSGPEMSELRDEVEELLPRLEPQDQEAIQRIVGSFEASIRTCQEELARARRREVPGVPVLVEAGVFRMGPGDEHDDFPNLMEVFVSAFLIDPCEVTKSEFSSFVKEEEAWTREKVYKKYGVPYFLVDWDGSTPPRGEWHHPVVNIHWFAAVAFCNWRSRRDGKEEVYSFVGDMGVETDLQATGWRLPTEAEWEKAGRAGLESQRLPWEGLTPAYLNYGKHFSGTTDVGSLPANQLGIYDMLGNVKEWCHDWYGPLRAAGKGEPVRDPTGPEAGNYRVFRGGSWMDRAEWIGLSKRGRLPPVNMNPDLGFRCVRRP